VKSASPEKVRALIEATVARLRADLGDLDVTANADCVTVRLPRPSANELGLLLWCYFDGRREIGAVPVGWRSADDGTPWFLEIPSWQDAGPEAIERRCVEVLAEVLRSPLRLSQRNGWILAWLRLERQDAAGAWHLVQKIGISKKRAIRIQSKTHVWNAPEPVVRPGKAPAQ
jgi:hypothetical protein